jgi:nitrite reductase/ring-hydroxylating ferredoxin subunit
VFADLAWIEKAERFEGLDRVMGMEARVPGMADGDAVYHIAIDAAALPPGTCKSLALGGKAVVLAHLSDGFHAMENRCSHADSALSTDRIYHGRQIGCPRHGARFDLKTGAAKSPPAFRPIAVFATRVVDGKVEIGLPPAKPAPGSSAPEQVR